ncbi:Putative uncharacterized protein [Taphrina deformans PYCC 5710]|uniref:t-SNARE coiled-coil homology domain-containing protein n=1 Tax=Taphrina deformans (strain PYCC 5710 / ATCC 11124 / CBS 356.35 / IMI 108563 / JCM 9778 / NBRC 8474) TaxID=1097556 RepID=R4X8Q9_TAPDE|nr:Putative uncharacterized protein [Taphrina deformans PYCC 5710]|eukprot:CCG81780.1 Putative uncharacterized protein [Taphrina deformans PYCC 5710]
MSSRYPQSARNPYANSSSSYPGYSHTDQESQNDSAVEGLRSKVAFLKDVSIKIGAETRDSLAYMSEMNEDYSKQNDFLKRTKNRLLNAANAQSWGWFHLFLFMMLVFLIFFLVYLFK